MPNYSRRSLIGLLLLLLPLSEARDASAQDDIGVQVPPGFKVTLYADDDLVHDAYCMTIDSLGRVVVSSAGYVRILIDDDNDGRADGYHQFVDGPRTGAQGMYFDGRDLLCVADAGLIRYRDADGDDRADGPAETLLAIKTGGEHHAHAIERGPDGWWYLIAGNFAEVTSAYASLRSSPIGEPRAGTVLRLPPDFKGSEIIADGYRNAYDFAFDWRGDLFVYDSDGEREVSLPWYQPTRLFQALPGSHAGWISRSWKLPDGYFDMAPVTSRLGRGSPTGVVAYRHFGFPEPYRNAIFVLDWTFGRVVVLPLKDELGHWVSEQLSFMTGVGDFGFAPTDACVGPDGSLYISVGGRGTRGSVFRVTYEGAAIAASDAQTPLEQCLLAPQPLSSWSRAQWLPLADRLGPQRLVDAALNGDLPPHARVRAIEILTELYAGLPAEVLRQLADDPAASVRARAAWSVGRVAQQTLSRQELLPYLRDKDPRVIRAALEALAGSEELPEPGVLSAVLEQSASPVRPVRQAVARTIATWPAGRLKTGSLPTGREGLAQMTIHLGTLQRAAPRYRAESLTLAVAMLLDEDAPLVVRRDAVRLAQLAVGDMGPEQPGPALYDGYRSRVDLEGHLGRIRERLMPAWRLYPTGDEQLDAELARTMALAQPDSAELLSRVLEQITPASHPSADIHQLIVASRNTASRNAAQRQKIAEALVQIEYNIAARSLQIDSNWEPHLAELFVQLRELDPALPQAVIQQPEFGLPGHTLFVEQMKGPARQSAINALAHRVQTMPDYAWQGDLIALLGESIAPQHLELIRSRLDDPLLHGAVVQVLAQDPQSGDLEHFSEALFSSDLGVVKAGLDALQALPPEVTSNSDVLLALVRTMRRLDGDSTAHDVRADAAGLLSRLTGRDFGFQHSKRQPQPEVVQRWTDWALHEFPNEAPQALQLDRTNQIALAQRLEQVDWTAGNVQRGATLFGQRSCAQCHGNRRALGPDLSGVTRRFGREDLFLAIVAPDRDVSPQYQTTQIQTTRGRIYTGLVIYESVDGLLLRTPANETIRVEAGDIEQRRTLSTSLMPPGLLDNLSEQELADLYAHLQSL